MMERFNYPNIKAVYEEDAEIFHLLAAESYGIKRDEQEEFEDQQAEIDAQRAEYSGQ